MRLDGGFCYVPEPIPVNANTLSIITGLCVRSSACIEKRNLFFTSDYMGLRGTYRLVAALHRIRCIYEAI